VEKEKTKSQFNLGDPSSYLSLFPNKPIKEREGKDTEKLRRKKKCWCGFAINN